MKKVLGGYLYGVCQYADCDTSTVCHMELIMRKNVRCLVLQLIQSRNSCKESHQQKRKKTVPTSESSSISVSKRFDDGELGAGEVVDGNDSEYIPSKWDFYMDVTGHLKVGLLKWIWTLMYMT